MTKREKVGAIVVCVVLLVFIGAWGGAGSKIAIDLPVPIGHCVEKDTSRIKLLNAQRCIIQARKAVVDNLTNSQTIGYKRNLARFIDSSTVILVRDMSQGELMMTNRSLDIGIAGRGYIGFTDHRGEVLYTRCGTLLMGPNGELMHANGYALDPAITVPSDNMEIYIGTDGGVNCTSFDGRQSVVGRIELAKFRDAGGLWHKVDGLYKETELSGMPVTGTPGSHGFGEIRAGFGESSNVNRDEEMRILEELKVVQNALDVVCAP